MKTFRLDNRGLTPPEPLVRILKICDELATGDRIESIMDRRPMFLLPELEERGFSYTCVEQGDRSFLLTIERP
ncbi:MAG: DUF2249 domain-containing protein [Vulcanimicrobiaceae bacterium]